MTATDPSRESLEMDDSKVKKDPVQSAIGDIGYWQIFICAIIFLLKFPVAWHQMGIIFLAPKPDFTCSNETLSRCDANCPQHVFNTEIFTNTIQRQWDLVCNREYLSNLSQTIFMLGILVGNMFFGGLADKLGRRIPLVIAVTVQLIFGVLASFATNYWIFVICRFITAAATGGTMVTSFVLVMEIIGIKYRELFSVLYQVPFNLGHLTLPLFAYYIRDWQKLQFALSIPSIVLLSYYWLIPESPRWLFTVGRVNESAKILEKAAKKNKLPYEHIKGDLESVQELKTEQVAKGTIVDLIRTKNMRIKTICMNFNWFVCGMCFFGVSQYVGEAGGNLFKNVAISASLEIPGTLVCILLLKYWGRKKTLIMSNCVSGFALLAIAFVDEGEHELIVILATIGIIGMCISFPTVYLYGGELFPTVIRNIAIGTASMIARIGSMISPFIASGLSKTAHWLPPAIFGIIPIIGAVLVLFLPETRGFPLPETIEDGENFGKKEKKKITA
ncbi:organic cation transporter protein-like isoform X2 [Chironomus tepperi]|uniref:organic cation transporter protein-like isoform X2 n=2 Tax=Chironomus tepperi TaxID=113505 RepID=UPI00391F4973